MNETKDSVKIRHLMEQAERLPKMDCVVVLKAVLATRLRMATTVC